MTPEPRTVACPYSCQDWREEGFCAHMEDPDAPEPWDLEPDKFFPASDEEGTF